MTEPGTSVGDLAKLDLANKIRQYHHNAIWEEQKHFTWLISIILSAQLLVLTSQKVDVSEKVILVIVGSVVGLLLAITGLLVQRREGVYFCKALDHFVAEYNSIFPDRKLSPPSQDANKRIFQLVLLFFIGKLGVRDYFQFLFLSFAFIFAGLALFAAICPAGKL